MINWTKLDDDTTVKTLTDENEKLKGFQTQIYKQNREKFSQSFDEIVEADSFDNIKSYLKIGELKDDKYDHSSLSDDDIVFNNNKIDEFRNLGLLETKTLTRQHVPPGKPPGGSLDKKIDIAGLARKDPKAAAKILAEDGLVGPSDYKIKDAYLKE